jgi:hypothetical protein
MFKEKINILLYTYQRLLRHKDREGPRYTAAALISIKTPPKMKIAEYVVHFHVKSLSTVPAIHPKQTLWVE